jgi:hypothetical protein
MDRIASVSNCIGLRADERRIMAKTTCLAIEQSCHISVTLSCLPADCVTKQDKHSLFTRPGCEAWSL